MQEIWKDIPGYEGFYQVSNLGRARSCARPATRGRILRLGSGGKVPYLGFTASKDNKQKRINVHRAVALSFIGRPNGLVVDHIDGDPKNNHLENLEYVTSRENSRRGKNGRRNKKNILPFGIHLDKNNKYATDVRENGRQVYLGCFDSLEEAKRCIAMAESQGAEYAKKHFRAIKYSCAKKGVSFIKSKKKYRAEGAVNGKKAHIGYFSCESDAVVAREEWEQLNGLR